MTRIDFHSNVGDSLLYACRLVRKAYQAGQPTTIVVAEPRAAARLRRATVDFLGARLRAALHGGHACSPRKRRSCWPQTSTTCRIIRCFSTSVRPCPRSSRASKGCSKWSATHMTNSLPGRERYRFYRDRGYALNNYKQGG